MGVWSWSKSKRKRDGIIDYRCWSCDNLMHREMGDISLTGDEVLHVCHKCWDVIPVERRISLKYLILPRERGGMGAAEALDDVRTLILGSLAGFRVPGNFRDQMN